MYSDLKASASSMKWRVSASGSMYGAVTGVATDTPAGDHAFAGGSMIASSADVVGPGFRADHGRSGEARDATVTGDVRAWTSLVSTDASIASVAVGSTAREL